ncbi:tRNA (N6-threonylcarbamoyladenosine(37)-N6)-methyltransferase TrmO [Chloroflexota bacterium]
MVNELPSMILKAIGTVRNTVKQALEPGYDWRAIVSEIVIDNNLTDALVGLDEFSHIIVIWWMHQAATREPLAKIHPMGNQKLPLVGLFATRSPNRPNPLGKATVRLLQCQGNVLKVEGLDAIDGTPVIDIKPYIPGHDSPAAARVPKWITTQ